MLSLLAAPGSPLGRFAQERPRTLCGRLRRIARRRRTCAVRARSAAVPESRSTSTPSSRTRCAQRRQRQPDDRRRVALDAVDERAAEAVDRERAGDLEQRLAGGDVRVDLGVVDVAAKRTVATSRPRRPRAPTAPPRWSMSQCPECSTPARPPSARASARARPRAGAACRRRSPSSSNAESPPRTSPSIGSPSCARADDRLGLRPREQLHDARCLEAAASASPAATTASSSTSGAIAIGSMPAARRVASRAGDVEARYRRMPHPAVAARLWNARAWLSPSPPSPEPRGGTRRPAAGARLDGPVVELDVDQRRPRRRLRGAPRGPRRVRVRRDPGRAGRRARITDRRQDRVLARRDPRGARGVARTGAPHVWAEASVERAPATAPGGADFGHIELGRPARAQGARCCATRCALRRRRASTSRCARSTRRSRPASRRRHRLAHPRAPARRRRRAWSARTRPAATRSCPWHPTAPRRRPRCAELAPLDAAVRPERGAIDLVAPAVGRRRDRGGRGRADAARPAPDDRRSASATASSGVDRDGFWQVHRGAAATLTRAPCRSSSTPTSSIPRPRTSTSTAASGCSPRRVGDRFGETVRITTVESDAARDRARGREPRRVGRRARGDRAGRPVRSTSSPPTRPPASARGSRGDGRARPAALGRRPGGRRRGSPQLRPRQLVYVACDPVALARDVGLLARARLRARRPATRSTCSRTRTTSRRSAER